jgi:hypothetical protein
MRYFFDWLLGAGDPPGERRRSRRCPALEKSALLMWREGGRTRISPAQLLNLSGVGAFVLAEEVPRQGHAVWLPLEEPEPTAWVKARVARHDGARKVGLDFLEHCPYDLFETATQRDGCTPFVAPEFADGYCR